MRQTNHQLSPVSVLCALGVLQCHKSTVFLVHKSPLRRVRDSLPYGDGLGVTRIHCSHVLVVPPVPARKRTVEVSCGHSSVCTDTARSCTRPPVIARWFGLILSEEEITHSCRHTQNPPMQIPNQHDGSLINPTPGHNYKSLQRRSPGDANGWKWKKRAGRRSVSCRSFRSNDSAADYGPAAARKRWVTMWSASSDSHLLVCNSMIFSAGCWPLPVTSGKEECTGRTLIHVLNLPDTRMGQI